MTKFHAATAVLTIGLIGTAAGGAVDRPVVRGAGTGVHHAAPGGHDVVLPHAPGDYGRGHRAVPHL